jgi:2-polyprenyl-3-methyl-5-hydroxy-6-metoxy-1,4-benzoquinol methylase
VLETGCSIGLMTRQLSERADAVLGIDVVASALDTARTTCAGRPGIRFELRAIPGEWPEGRYDLIMLSEVLCFFDRTDLARIVSLVEASLLPGGDVVIVNWLGATNFPLTGEEASEGFIAGAAPFAHVVHQERTEKYRLDVLTRGLNGNAVG